MNRYVYDKYFWKETSNGMGTFHQLVLSRMFADLDEPHNMSYDHLVSNDWSRVEGKMARACSNPVHTIKSLKARSDESLEMLLEARIADSLRSRALVSIKGDHTHGVTRDGAIVPIANRSLQQITVAKADLLLGTMVFLDRMRFYLIPMQLICPKVGMVGKRPLVMSPQHGNDYEGVLFLEKIVPFFVHETTLPISQLDKKKLSISNFLAKSLGIAKKMKKAG